MLGVLVWMQSRQPPRLLEMRENVRPTRATETDCRHFFMSGTRILMGGDLSGGNQDAAGG